MYSKPWDVTRSRLPEASGDLMEYICTENERDAEHLDSLKGK